jgi:hypothetical protein
VATVNQIVRLSRSGAILQTYSDPSLHGWYTLAVTPDGRRLWAGTEGGIAQFDLATGKRLVTTIPAFSVALAVAGEPRMAFTAAVPASVPLLGGLGLTFAGVLLAAVALLRVR